MLLDECEQGVIHQCLIAPSAGSFDLGAKVFDYGVVNSNGDFRFPWFARNDGTALGTGEVNIAVRFSGDLFHTASFAVCLPSKTR